MLFAFFFGEGVCVFFFFNVFLFFSVAFVQFFAVSICCLMFVFFLVFLFCAGFFCWCERLVGWFVRLCFSVVCLSVCG